MGDGDVMPHILVLAVLRGSECFEAHAFPILFKPLMSAFHMVAQRMNRRNKERDKLKRERMKSNGRK